MAGPPLRCRACRRETVITAGTIFEGTRKPLRAWFLAMWFVTSQKNGVSALGLQRALGLGSYETSWTWLHKLRRAMVLARPRPPCRRDRGRRNLCGQPGRRQAGPGAGGSKATARPRLNRRGTGRIRLRRVKDVPSRREPVGLPARSRGAGRQFTPTAGEDTPGCRRPATAIRSRRASAAARNWRTRSCHASTKSPPCSNLGVVVGNSPGRHPAPTSRRLPRRIHLPLQSASITGPRPPVPPPRPAGDGHRTGPLPLHHHTQDIRQSPPNWVMKGIPTLTNIPHTRWLSVRLYLNLTLLIPGRSTGRMLRFRHECRGGGVMLTRYTRVIQFSSHAVAQTASGYSKCEQR